MAGSLSFGTESVFVSLAFGRGKRSGEVTYTINLFVGGILCGHFSVAVCLRIVDK